MSDSQSQSRLTYMSSYTTIRVSTELHQRISAIAKAEDRAIGAVVKRAIERYDAGGALVVSESPQASDCPNVRSAVVDVDARRVVLDNVPRHLLSNTVTRTGLEQQVQQMTKDGCDPRGITLALQEWTNRPDAYPGHLPHIYTELLRQRTARPKSKVDDKVRGWLELGEQFEREGR